MLRLMTTFLLTTGIIIRALGFVSCVSSKCGSHKGRGVRASLLPGDIKYESPSGKFRFFPITTLIVISVILTLVLYFLS